MWECHPVSVMIAATSSSSIVFRGSTRYSHLLLAQLMTLTDYWSYTQTENALDMNIQRLISSILELTSRCSCNARSDDTDFMWIRFTRLDKKKKPQYLEIPLVIQPYWPQMYETRTEALGEEVGDIREGEKEREGRGEKKSVHTNNQHGLYLCGDVFIIFYNIYRSQPPASSLRWIITSSHSRVVISLITSRCLSSHYPCESELLEKKE